MAYSPNESDPELNLVKEISVHDHQQEESITADVVAPKQIEQNVSKVL